MTVSVPISGAPKALVLATLLANLSGMGQVMADTRAGRNPEADQRCQATLEALALPGQKPLTYDRVDANTAPAVLEVGAPYCGVKVMWYLVGQRIAAGEKSDALRWLLLARSRTLLERMIDPRAFHDNERWRYRRLDRVYGAVLDPYRLANPQVEVEQIRRALSWDRLYPSLAYPPAQWPGLHVTMRARLETRLKELQPEGP